jgi:hypothetical protein
MTWSSSNISVFLKDLIRSDLFLNNNYYFLRNYAGSTASKGSRRNDQQRRQILNRKVHFCIRCVGCGNPVGAKNRRTNTIWTRSGPSSLPVISLASAGRSSSELRRRFCFRRKGPLNGPGDETCTSYIPICCRGSGLSIVENCTCNRGHRTWRGEDNNDVVTQGWDGFVSVYFL